MDVVYETVDCSLGSRWKVVTQAKVRGKEDRREIWLSQ